MLEVRGVSKIHKGIVVLREVSLTIEEKEVVGIFGPNGSGKSTLLKVISGIEKPNCGRIIFNDTEITNMPPFKISRLGIVYAFQIPRPFKDMTVYENVVLGYILHHSRSEAEELADKLLKEFNFDKISNLKAVNLSQGEMKILEVLRAIATEPKVLLLDEPFAGLDVKNAKRMIEIVQKLKSKVTIVMTAHRMRLLEQVAERFIEIRDGKIIKEFRSQTSF